MQTSSTSFAKVAVKSANKLKNYSESERQYHCESWRRSGLSMNQYCRQAGIGLSTLSTWISANKPPSAPLPSVGIISKQSVEIILLNGIRLHLTDITSINEVLKLIQAVSSCN